MQIDFSKIDEYEFLDELVREWNEQCSAHSSETLELEASLVERTSMGAKSGSAIKTSSIDIALHYNNHTGPLENDDKRRLVLSRSWKIVADTDPPEEHITNVCKEMLRYIAFKGINVVIKESQ